VNKLFSLFREPAAVRLSISPEVLAALVKKGELHATDFRCLDFGSKQIVWKIFLSLAKSRLSDNISHWEE